MRLIILSRANHLYSTQSLFLAARKKGHFVEILDYMQLNTIISQQVQLYYHDEMISEVDAVIGRISPVYTVSGAAILQQFAQIGAYLSPKPDALLLARDKFRAQAVLMDRGIDMPAVALVNDTFQLEEIIDQLGGFPIIIKLIDSTHGAGVMLVNDMKGAKSTTDAFLSIQKTVILQEYIPESNGEDLRVIVCGSRAVAAMKRIPAKGEFRSNLHRGGFAKKVYLTKAEEEAAIEAANIIGLDIAGVDILRSKRGPLVIEVNASPGLEGIEDVTQINIAQAMIEQLESGAKQR